MKIFEQSVSMILVRRKSQVEGSKVMKSGINYELKAGNIIIHAPVDTPKHPINIFEMHPDGTNKTTYGRKRGQATQRNLRVRLCRFSPLER